MTVRIVVNPCGDEADDPFDIELVPQEHTSSLATRLASLFNHPGSFYLMDSRTPHSYLRPDSIISELCLGPEDFLIAIPLDPPPPDPEDAVRERIDRSRTLAFADHPAAFCPAQRSFVEAEINGVRVTLLVDSGSCRSIMSLDVARECQLRPFVDPSFQQEFEGLGQAMTVGDLWDVELNVGGFVSRTAFSVLDGPESLLGMDWLLPNGAIVNLPALVLLVGGWEVPLLLGD
jgi:hypothetical protein